MYKSICEGGWGLNYNSTITKVVIPDSVTKIGMAAFYMNSGLLEIDIPDSVTTIGGNAFLGTPWLDSKRADVKSCLVIVNNSLIDARNYRTSLYLILQSSV